MIEMVVARADDDLPQTLDFLRNAIADETATVRDRGQQARNLATFYKMALDAEGSVNHDERLDAGEATGRIDLNVMTEEQRTRAERIIAARMNGTA